MDSLHKFYIIWWSPDGNAQILGVITENDKAIGWRRLYRRNGKLSGKRNEPIYSPKFIFKDKELEFATSEKGVIDILTYPRDCRG